MFLSSKDLLLRDKVEVYNNLAEINGVQGRLHAKLEIWPRGRLEYDFQVIGEVGLGQALHHRDASGRRLPPINGHFFSIDEPYNRGRSYREGPTSAIYGDAAKATFGDASDKAHAFTFFLPNTRFRCQRANQQLIVAETKIQATGRKLSKSDSGFYFEVPVDDTWTIGLQILKDACNWLDPKKRNLGVRLTTEGALFQHKFSFQNPESFNSLVSKSLEQALKELRVLSALLSFANGGYLGPFYVQGRSYHNDTDASPVNNLNAFVLNYQTTPLERLNNTWLTWDSDIPAYVKRLPTFKKLLDEPGWKSVFRSLQKHYIQALNADSLDIGFSTLGSALERLAYAILVLDQDNEELRQNL